LDVEKGERGEPSFAKATGGEEGELVPRSFSEGGLV